jgi:type II secretory pathway component HofQ
VYERRMGTDGNASPHARMRTHTQNGRIRYQSVTDALMGGATSRKTDGGNA